MVSKSAVLVSLIVAAGVLVCAHRPAESEPLVLITAEEAMRPAPPSPDLTFRAGISRGPGIQLVSPKASEKSVHSPVHLRLKFEGRGGAQVDPDSIKFTYIKNPAADLTGRVKGFANPDGIDVPEAEIPPGTHVIRADVKDKEGRSGFLIFKLNVVK